ncbi:hypothetical protein [Bacillus paranthracis]|uniref:hypothetical protein n=1 Tax=Bacillus paranthracis TaxID=2026186 RepID=UPI0007AB3D80|nr:hypothetical protein [Bacillus paranthracis]
MRKSFKKSPPSPLCSVLAKLFLARAVALPSRYTKKEGNMFSTWISNYTCQTAILTLENSTYSTIRYVKTAGSPRNPDQPQPKKVGKTTFSKAKANEKTFEQKELK